MKKVRTTLNEVEKEFLKEVCENNNCTTEEFFNAIASNVVSEQLSIQIYYDKTGELPK